MGILDGAFKRVSNKRFLVQSDLLLSNMLGILKTASGDVNDSATLDIFLSVPLAFENRDFDTGTTIAFASAASRPNINWLVENNVSNGRRDPYAPVPLNPTMEEYLDRILTVYNVSDKILFVSMVADTIDTDLDERSAGSEIALEDPDFSQGHLYDMHHFTQVLDAYEALTLDPFARKIPWESLIGFRNDSLDFNHITPEALQYLAEDIPVEQLAQYTTQRAGVYESLDDLPFDARTKEKLKKLRVVFYSPNVSGDILIKNGERQLHVTFLYNLGSKKVSDIEMAQ